MSHVMTYFTFVCISIYYFLHLPQEKESHTISFVNCYRALYYGNLLGISRSRAISHSRIVENNIILMFDADKKSEKGLYAFDVMDNIYFFPLDREFDTTKVYLSMLDIASSGKKYSHYKWEDAEKSYWPVYSRSAIGLTDQNYDHLRRSTVSSTIDRNAALQKLKRIIAPALSSVAQTHKRSLDRMEVYRGDEHVARGYYHFTENAKSALHLCRRIPDVDLVKIIDAQMLYFKTTNKQTE